jgi:hypothetical protein
MPPGDGGDHAVDQSAGRDASLATAVVDACGALEVRGRIEVVQVESQQKAAQVRLPASLGALARIFMITGSVTAIGPSAAITSERRRSAVLPMARSVLVRRP